LQLETKRGRFEVRRSVCRVVAFEGAVYSLGEYGTVEAEKTHLMDASVVLRSGESAGTIRVPSCLRKS
jgi:hypothetical protein